MGRERGSHFLAPDPQYSVAATLIPLASVRIPACTAVPHATAWSGSTSQLGSLLKKSLIICRMCGTLVVPPTSTIWSTSCLSYPLSCSTCSTGQMALWNKVPQIFSASTRLSVLLYSRPWKKLWIAIVASEEEESEIFACSTSCRSMSTAAEFSIADSPDCSLNSASRYSSNSPLKSSPPRCSSPQAATTSNTPPSKRRRLTSRVPPPKSYTRMLAAGIC
mmetsp:Transcript_30822/g.99101  ORF Transcript_30822/g.99101 Transcript_30822/m.99101 type:complete len:220 (+) Transcript_30822:537-1196(+)